MKIITALLCLFLLFSCASTSTDPSVVLAEENSREFLEWLSIQEGDDFAEEFRTQAAGILKLGMIVEDLLEHFNEHFNDQSLPSCFYSGELEELIKKMKISLEAGDYIRPIKDTWEIALGRVLRDLEPCVN